MYEDDQWNVSPDGSGISHSIYDKPPIFSEIETKTLEPIRLAVQSAISKRALVGLKDAELSTIYNDMLNAMIVRLEAKVYSDPSQSYSETLTIREEKSHPDWKHALIASLPRGSFRRGWLGDVWGIDPEYQSVYIEHTVTVNVPAVLPELQREFPDDFGRIMYPIQRLDSYARILSD